jgi:hypothetical protein
MTVRRLDVHVMDQLARVRFASLTKRTQIALTKQGLVCSMALQRRKISSCMVLMSQTPLQRPHHLNRVSSDGQTTLFMHSGRNIRNVHLYLQGMLSLFCPLCEDIRSHLNYGKNMLMLFSENLDSPQRCMNHASTRVQSIRNV